MTLRDDPARAWAPFEPGPSSPWDLGRVAHLHRRAGFAAPWAILARDLADGPGPSVERLLGGEPTALDGTPTAQFDGAADAIAAGIGPDTPPARLRAAWVYRMLLTPRPLVERMTLFWHGHFATSIAKVGDTAMMARQNTLLRTHALGRFGDLLTAIGRDPAMLVWLDAANNPKARPNENYAREVMELFALGRGAYTEADIREAARALTGRSVARGECRDRPLDHDDGTKAILGRTGTFTGDDLVPILLDQPACAGFLARKLHRLFLSEVDEPSDALLAPLAESLRSSGYDVGAAVRTILRSNLVFDPSSRRRRVKSPIELGIGTARALELARPTVSALALGDWAARAGQSLFAPPSVAGWDGGKTWIHTAAMLERTNLVLALLGKDADGGLGGRFHPAKLAARHGIEPGRFFVDLLIQDGLPIEAMSPHDAARLVLTAPEYQLS